MCANVPETTYMHMNSYIHILKREEMVFNIQDSSETINYIRNRLWHSNEDILTADMRKEKKEESLSRAKQVFFYLFPLDKIVWRIYQVTRKQRIAESIMLVIQIYYNRQAFVFCYYYVMLLQHQ